MRVSFGYRHAHAPMKGGAALFFASGARQSTVRSLLALGRSTAKDREVHMHIDHARWMGWLTLAAAVVSAVWLAWPNH